MAIIQVLAGQSIQQAINAAKNGDTVLVAPGVYRETLTISGKAITLASEFLTTGDPNAIMTTIIDGGGSLVDSDPDVVRFTDTVPAGAKLIGFTVRNGGDGIKVEGTKVDILNNYITNTIDGINYKLVTTGVSGGTARNNLIENNKDDGVDINQIADVVVEDNIIRKNGNDGIEVRMNSYTGTTILNNIIRNNTISFNNGDGIQLIDYPEVSQRYYRIENNLIEGNRDAGLGLMDNGDSSEDYRAASIPEPIDVIGNTFKNNNHGLTGGDNLVAINNIFINHSRIAMKGVDGNSIAAYNLFWNNGTNIQGSNVDTSTTIFADPLLSLTSELQTGSPAIDKGTALFQWLNRTVLDLTNSSYNGSAPDLGAFESGTTSPQPQGSIGNRIWNDTDGDGIQDAEETGIANVSVKLLNSAQQIIATKATNSNGYYTFNNLLAGSYTVQVDSSTLPSGAEITSDPDATQDGQSVVTLATDETKVNIDFGYKLPAQPPQPKVIEVRINDGVDDAEQSATGAVNLTSTDLELVTDRNNQTVGLRFNGINIQRGVTITNAYIQFKVDEISTDATNLTIHGEASNNAAFFTTATNNISSRAKTTASVAWNPASWNTVGAAGVDQRTSNIASVIQEIINRPGWESGNSIATIITGTGKRVAKAYNGDIAGAPLLHIEYSDQPPPILASIGDRIWNDLDSDGIQDVGESGIAGVKVKLLNSSNQEITTKVTDSDGKYLFDNLQAGTYNVEVDTTTLPTGYMLTGDPDAQKDGKSLVNLTAGENNLNQDFGYKLPPSPKVIEVRISSSSDDAEQNLTNGSVNFTSSDLELVNDGVDQLVGLHFVGVNIPQGSKINNAYIQFKVDEASSGATNLTIRGQDADTAATFTTTSGNISSRVLTDASVIWNPVAWTTVGAAGVDQRTPNLAAVIQEIVNRQGWSSGNSIATIISGTGKRTAESYNGDALGAPLLHVEFTPPESSII